MSASAFSSPPRSRRRSRRPPAPWIVRAVANAFYDRPLAFRLIGAIILVSSAWLIADVWRELFVTR
jgi:hypothetical protein